MEFATNELGQPVVYLVNYSRFDPKSVDYLIRALPTLDEAKALAKTNSYYVAREHNMLTGQTVDVEVIERNRVLKARLVDLYKSGAKRKAFEALVIRESFPEQVNFPLVEEMKQANKKAHAKA